MTVSNRWERKLQAFMQDSPLEALDAHPTKDAVDAFVTHADRLPFPVDDSVASSCDENLFHHPLGGSAYPLNINREAIQKALEALPVVPQLPNVSAAAAQRAECFYQWRMSGRNLAAQDSRLAFLPADPRLPDHTIYHHKALMAAFAGTGGKPAFLRFHLGPVQSFIAAARSTRDLWSGSYLLSWLISRGLKTLTAAVGPDAVIFPNLLGQPIFDLQWKKNLWDKLNINGKTAWKGFDYTSQQLLTPNFPNVFLALVPADLAEKLAKAVKKAMVGEWTRIANEVWEFSGLTSDKKVFDRQIQRHLSISWQVTPFPESLDEAESLAQQLPEDTIRKAIKLLRKTFEKNIDNRHRDAAFYTAGKLNNLGLAWSVMVAYSMWQLDAVRQTRAFDAWAVGGGSESQGQIKDALTGKEEAIPLQGIASGNGDLVKFFKHEKDKNERVNFTESVGAVTIVKRLWHMAYLQKKWDFKKDDFKMPNTQSMAKGRYEDDNAEEESSSDEGKYFAIIALDGDDMGKWVSGAKTPTFKEQLANNINGISHYLEKHQSEDFLDAKRLLTPSYHLQFSEALSNFALYIAPKIVEAHSGRLIYAGGDDVLAMLPATEAIACANDLQRALRGQAPSEICSISQVEKGFLRAKDGPVLIVPGPRSSASVGIAMAHAKAPLQDVVKAAQAAESRAKRFSTEKNAFAVSVFKHSGEITEWDGCFRNSAAMDAYENLLRLILDGVFSDKFPHAMLEFITPYFSEFKVEDCEDFDFAEAVKLDLASVVERQRGPNYSQDKARSCQQDLETYLNQLKETEIVLPIQAVSSSSQHTNKKHKDRGKDKAPQHAKKSGENITTTKLKQLAGMLTVLAFIARQPSQKQGDR